MRTNGLSKNVNKYPIADLKSLEEYIVSCDKGLVVDENLLDCYKGIEEDLEVVKRFEHIRVIKDKKIFILFYRNLEDDVEKELQELDPEVREDMISEWVST
jgi:hypothetical protein